MPRTEGRAECRAGSLDQPLWIGRDLRPQRERLVDTRPRVLNGLGVAIISTSKGVMTDKEAKKLNVGGEVLCYIS